MFRTTPQSFNSFQKKSLGFLEKHLSTFHFFPRLPTELRLVIWKEACRDERTVTVFSSDRVLDAKFSQGHGDLPFYTFRSRNSIPGVLHANGESRFIAMKFYLPVFDTRMEFPLITTLGTGTASSIWINPSTDLICPMTSMTDDQCDALAQKMRDVKVERIALNDCAFQKSASIPCDKWGTFSTLTVPFWMNEDIREVTIYTSRYLVQPDEDIELTKFDRRAAFPPKMMKSKMEISRLQNTSFGNLQKILKKQLLEDEKNKKHSRECVKLAACPQWLFDCRRKWTRPEQREMVANSVDSVTIFGR
ncbi:hypothetical protein BELL_0131g00130 [Botrytis elliptica]|uniref:2EXR domain-containing protein n=1 Tax=Botrytis elliptica TaxID=278938 RepID=A0A4Z1K056_9HELO|nr:hypothetical protein EAE99_005585 [Botrytis elliptica]TGO76922.1 hypothetical protein BELL_0131g00130 [Botrytis elliptica]